MWPFGHQQYTGVLIEDPQTETQPEPQAPERQAEPEPEPGPALRCGHLIRFGRMWIDFDAIGAINFAPSDGCGVEVQMKAGGTWHLHGQEVRALQRYVEARSETNELERIGALESSG